MTAAPDREAVEAVRAACEREDARTLRSLISPDAVALVDTGGDLIASTRPVVGDALVRELLGAVAGADLALRHVNGAWAIAGHRGGRVVLVVSLAFEGSHVVGVWITLSPLKLRRLN